MNNNQKLIDAVNCKFPQNNLIELYYNIGRALPFTGVSSFLVGIRI